MARTPSTCSKMPRTCCPRVQARRVGHGATARRAVGVAPTGLVGLSERRILVILVTQDGQVHNRIINVERDYTPSELVQAANYFSETYVGQGLAEVRRHLLRDIEVAGEHLRRIMDLATRMAREALTEEDKGDELMVSGESNLMDIPDLADVRKLRLLFDAFSTKRDPLHLLDQSMRAGGVKIFIGAEASYAGAARMQHGDGAVQHRRHRGRHARRHRPDAHVLRAGDPDCGHYRQA